MDSDRIKHLEFIQGVITRMGSNSFQMKGWMIAIVSALLAIYAADKQNHMYALVAILPTAVFWGLDSYYLWQERKFRKLYNDILDNPDKVKLFSMPVGDYPVSYWDVVGSITILPLYLPVALILLVVYFVF